MHAIDRRHNPPLWLTVLLGALPLALNLLATGLPDGARPYDHTFQWFFFVSYVICSVPLVWIQRRVLRSDLPLWACALAMLAVTYAMSAVVSLNTLKLADDLGLVAGGFKWRMPLRGLGSTWMALVSFCVFQALLAHAFELRDERQRRSEATGSAREAELRALRYQLNPHFLFNSLHAISSLVAAGEARRADRMIARLGDFLRATLEERDRHECSLAEELALVEQYLDVERVRLGDRLRATTRAGRDTLDASVPVLLLQPLVENAIRHGIAKLPDGGQLTIVAAREGHHLRLTIENDVGDDAVPAQGHAAIGWRNTRERLEQLHGRDHGLSARVADGRYRVEIVLPYRALPLPAFDPSGAPA